MRNACHCENTKVKVIHLSKNFPEMHSDSVSLVMLLVMCSESYTDYLVIYINGSLIMILRFSHIMCIICK